MERFFVKQIEKLIRYVTIYWGRVVKLIKILQDKIKGYPSWVYPFIIIILGLFLFISFYFRSEIGYIFVYTYTIIFNLVNGLLFYPKIFLGFIYSIASGSLFAFLGLIKFLYTKVFSEDSPFYVLFPFIEKFVSICNDILVWYVERGWYYLLKWTLIFIGSYAFYQWFRYTVPKRDEEYYLSKGATLLFIYRLRSYDFKSFYKTYSEPFYDGLMGIFIILCYTFYRQLWEVFVAYIKNSIFRSKVNRWFRRKLRRPFVWVFVRFNWIFYLISFSIQIVMLSVLNFFKLIILISPKIFFIISCLLFIFFCWLFLHRLIFDQILFLITKGLGIRFPRPTLGTRSSSVSFLGSSIFSKVSTASVDIKLNSLVDLKNTNVHLVGSSFSQMPSIVYRKLKYKPSRKWSSIKGLMSPLKTYPLYSRFKRDFYNANLVHKLNRFNHRNTYIKLNSHTKRPLISSSYGSRLNHLRFKGSIFFPKIVSNKLDLSTFVLKELFIKNCNKDNNFVINNKDKKLPLNFLFNPIKNLAVPGVSLFESCSFFFRTNSPNLNFFKNRNSSILSDLFYPLLRYKLNRSLQKDSTFFPDLPLSKYRSGGSFRYKNFYTYKLGRLESTAGSRFLGKFKFFGMFPKKRVKVLPLSSFSSSKPLRLLKKEAFYWRKAFQRPFWRPLIRVAYRRNFKLFFRRKRISILLKKGYRLSKKIKRARLRFGRRHFRKFIFNRFFLNKYNKNYSFYRKRYKLSKNASYKIAFVYKQKFNGVKRQPAVSVTVGAPVINRKNRLNYLSLSSSLKSLRRYIILILKYQNKRKFFRHGSRFLVRSRLGKKISKGRRYYRKLFSNNNFYLSFLRSIYKRNYRILLAIKGISTKQDFSYLPLFYVLEKPWWYNNSSLENRGYCSLNFYNFRPSSFKLGISLRRYYRTWLFMRYLTRIRLGKRKSLSARYLNFHRYYTIRRRKNLLTKWFKSPRIKYWYFLNYGTPASALFTNFPKDYRRTLFDFSPRRYGLWRVENFDVIPPFLFKFKKNFYKVLWRHFKVLIYSLTARSSLFLIALFFFGLIFGSSSF